MCERTGACHMVSLSSGDVYISGCFEAPESQECYHVGRLSEHEIKVTCSCKYLIINLPIICLLVQILMKSYCTTPGIGGAGGINVSKILKFYI